MTTTIPRIAWRNLWRNWKRTALALLAIGVGQWALLATQGIMRGYADNIQQTITGPMVGHLQIHAPGYRDKRAMDRVLDDVEPLVDRLRALPGVADAAARIYAPVLVAPVRDAYVATVVGVDVAAESKPFGMLSGYTGELRPGGVLIGEGLARRIKATVGQEIAILGSAVDGSMANDLYTVQAIISSPVELVNQHGIVMGLADARALMIMPGQAHEIIIRADRLDQVDGIMTTLAADPALAGQDVATWREIMPEFVMIIEMVDYVGYFLLALVLVAALAGITNTLMMATYERRVARRHAGIRAIPLPAPSARRGSAERLGCPPP
jgi:ABC-type lipoprotein release transport system permease subunit